MEDNNNLITINFKISKELRDKFKKVAKDNRTTMQSILYSLVENYIENADHLKLKIIDMRSQYGK